MSVDIEMRDIPQANSLRTVYLTVLAVSRGNRNYQEIARFLQISERQGRYYRRASELLRLTKVTAKNRSELTILGKELLERSNYNPDKIELLKPYVLAVPIISEVLEEFEDDAYVSKEEVLNELLKISQKDSNNSTAKRRLSTLISWLHDTGVFSNSGEHIEANRIRKFRLSKQIKNSDKPSSRTILNFQDFVNNINSHIPIPYQTAIGQIEEQSLKSLLKVKNIEELDAWLTLDGSDKIARLICFISENDNIDTRVLMSELTYFKNVSLTYGRLLIENDRSLRGLSAKISKGGNALEMLLANYCRNNNLTCLRDHLFEGLSKNVDFYIPELNLAIECKFTKTSGTKHGGALKDICSLAKGKYQNKYKLGLLIAGEQFIKDKHFQTSIFKLKDDGILDIILTPKDLGKSPHALVETSRKKILAEEVEIEVLTQTTWSEELSGNEHGLDDASRWLERFMTVNHLNLKSLLHTWIMQTPFAIQTLRLILGWSESKMSSFLKNTLNDTAWKSSISDFSQVSIVVDLIYSKISICELSEVQEFYNRPINLMDFIVCRESALRGSAIRKKDTSKYFIKYCQETSRGTVIEETETLTLPSGAKLKSNFKIEIDGQLKNVLCKYYATSGSVMSDLVKAISEITEIGKEKEWLFIIDGAGWLNRKKDLNRLLSLVQGNNIVMYTLETWKYEKSVS